MGDASYSQQQNWQIDLIIEDKLQIGVNKKLTGTKIHTNDSKYQARAYLFQSLSLNAKVNNYWHWTTFARIIV